MGIMRSHKGQESSLRWEIVQVHLYMLIFYSSHDNNTYACIASNLDE